jgi:NAD(P)-dependent dehydrogenase (short-subunit alcohol dehydrogenase family)
MSPPRSSVLVVGVGASRGLGAAIARRFVAEAANTGPAAERTGCSIPTRSRIQSSL